MSWTPMVIRSFQKRNYSFTSGDYSMEILTSMKTSQQMTLIAFGQNNNLAHAASEIKEIFKLDNKPDFALKAQSEDTAQTLKSTK